MDSRKEKSRRQSRAALAWGLAVFVAGEALLTVALETWRPDLRDPEFGTKRALLLQQVAAHPDQPLLLFLGTSRTSLGIRPDIVAAQMPAKENPLLLFNMGVSGCGPVLELMYLQRLLADDIHPRWLVLEVLLPMLMKWDEGERIAANRLGWQDLFLLERYSSLSGPPGDRIREWTQSRLLPTYNCRTILLNRLSPAWLPWHMRQDHFWGTLDQGGWTRHLRETVAPHDYDRGLSRAREEYMPLLGGKPIAKQADRALRDLLAECQRRGITVVLLISPEGSDFRSWYSPETHHRLQEYLERVGQEYRIRCINAQDWLPDSAFSDGHHLLPSGARAFSERLGQELPAILTNTRAPVRD